MSNSRGNLFVISGFSGAGKGTIMRWFKKQEQYAVSVSCTSRAPRPNEKEGVDYYYITHEEYLKRVSEGYFLEHATYVDHGYGTPAAFVEENLAAGKDVLLEIEMQGALQVKEAYPDTTLIFITPPSAGELKRRLTSRNTETPEQIGKRLRRAAQEGAYMDQYDYIVVNDCLDTCIQELDALIKSQRYRLCNNRDLVGKIQEELKTLNQ
jgi:guanylate kinase